jgi:twitching motility protein PilT
MALVDSLLSAIERAGADALVMHVGERPYLVTKQGRIELASRALTLEAVEGLLTQLLPLGEKQALADLGAVEHPLTWQGRQAFRVIAARGGDDIWIEICRYQPKPVPGEAVAEEVPPSASRASAPSGSAAEQGLVVPVEASEAAETAADRPGEAAVAGPLVPASAPSGSAAAVPPAGPRPAPSGVGDLVAPPSVGLAGSVLREATVEASEEPTESLAPPIPIGVGGEGNREADEAAVFELNAGDLQDVDEVLREVGAAAAGPPPAEPSAAAPERSPGGSSAALAGQAAPPASPRAAGEPEKVPAALEASGDVTVPPPAEPPSPAVVVPMLRSPVRTDPASSSTPVAVASASSDLDRLLRLAAARAASALYIVAGMRPVIRVDGEINILGTEAVLDAATVQTMILDRAPEPSREALRSGALTEWICDVPDVGRVRCMSFRDHRGPGAIFRMIPARAISAEQLGLSREIQALCGQPDGLVLVSGPRSSGKSTLVAAFVDLINRTRADHVITLESQIKFVHESRRSFVSQREVRGSAEEMLAAARAALREDPDVLVFEDLRTPETVAVALEAAESGRLVIAALPAPSTTAAIERIIDQAPADRRPQIQQMLAGALRGVVAQVLLRKIGGGRLAARELLLNTAPVASLIASGQTFQLPLALDSGRRHGMVPLNDALVGYVQSGVVDGREAYRWAYDKDGFVNLLKRAGCDTSFIERLA